MDKLLSFLGMCKKAGALTIGEEAVGAAMRKGKTYLILTASDAADNTAKRADNYAQWGGNILTALPYTKQELGDMLGKRLCAVIAITDLPLAMGFAEKLSNEYEKNKDIYNDMLERYGGRKSGRRNGKSSKAIGRNANGEV